MTEPEAMSGPEIPEIDDDAYESEWLDHSGYVIVVGKPNVGKSTLMNRFLGEKIAIVSPRPQTTRLRQLGIYTHERTQIVFVDTPGIHEPRHRLGEFMVSVAVEALRDADVILFVADVSAPPDEDDQRVAELIREARGEPDPESDQTDIPVVMALNKIDRAKPDALLRHSEAFRTLLPDADWTALSATLGDGVDDLLRRITALLPPGPQYFPGDQLSDMAVRDIVAEIVREKVLLNLEQEVPHAQADRQPGPRRHRAFPGCQGFP
jgi:GTP-binding protein Era